MSPSKSFADGGRAAFGDGSVTAVKKLDKRVTGKDPRLVKLFNKGELYHLRLGSDKKVYYGTKKELDEIFKNRKRAGGDTTIGLEKKKYPDHVINCMSKLHPDEDINDKKIPKIICDLENNLLYSSYVA